MAGIGFLLKNLLKEDRYISDFKANLYSLMLSSGPWIFAVICIAVLNAVAAHSLSDANILLFRAILVYAFAFSLISSSLFQLIFTRFISDKLYQREYSSLLPNFFGVMALCGMLNFLLSALYMCTCTNLNFLLKVMGIILFCTVGFQWMVMTLLGAIRDFIRITLIFMGGFLWSFAAAISMGYYMSIDGYILGFTVGQVLVLLLLMERVGREFTLGRDRIFEFTRYFRKFPPLVWAAMLYNLGFWMDKILIWYSPWGFDISGSFRSHYPYDSASFLATLTIIPAISIFFLHVETDFYEGLRKYINIILNKGIFETIEHQRLSLMELLKRELSDVFKVQFLVTFIMILLAPWFLEFIGYQKYVITTTYVLCLVGSFFQVILLTLIVLFWYLEMLNESLFSTIVFLLLNLAFNYYNLYYAPNIPLGTGYMLATFFSVLISIIVLMRRLRFLNYMTFMQRPLFEAQREMPKFH